MLDARRWMLGAQYVLLESSAQGRLHAVRALEVEARRKTM